MKTLLAVLASALLTAPPAPTIVVAASAGPIHVGDPVAVEIAVVVPDEARPIFPEWQESWGDGEIREIGEIHSTPGADGMKRVSQQITLTFFQAGEVTLPAPLIRLGSDSPNSEETEISEPPPPVVLKIESLLPPGEEIPEPQPPAPPQPLSWGTSFLWTSAVLGLLSLAALIFVERQRRLATAAIDQTVDPLTSLEAALDSLRSGASVEEMFEGMSLHLRRFFGQSLAFPAAESTTSEIRLQLREKELPPSVIQRAEALLRQCDGVKFARRELARQDAEHGLGEAAAIGTETISSLAPPPPIADAEETS